MTTKYNEIRESLKTATERDRKEMASGFDAAREANRVSTLSAIIVALIFLSMLGLLSFFILRMVTRALKDMTSVALGLAASDLSQPLLNREGSNEIAQLCGAIDQMAEALRNQVSAIKRASGNLLDNTSQVTSATSQLASAASEQASAIAETTSTLEEINQAGLAAKQSAGQIVESSEKSVEVSREGLASVEASRQEMERIRGQVEAISEGVSGLRSQISEVGEIITLVSQVAEQSNLLAVNASIEAAKAGESGRGFAVVAKEVKNLAAQSKQATTQVRNTLSSIQEAIEQVFDVARAGRERTEAGVRSIKDTGDVISRLSENILGAAESAKRIAVAANEQVVGLDQVSQAMTDVNQASVENLESTQQVERNGEKLVNLARDLEKLIAEYQVAS